MSYMEITGWIREFDEQVEIFLALHAVPGLVELFLAPISLPFFLYLLMVIPLHGSSVSYGAEKRYNLSHVAGLDYFRSSVRTNSLNTSDCFSCNPQTCFLECRFNNCVPLHFCCNIRHHAILVLNGHGRRSRFFVAHIGHTTLSHQ